MVGIPGNSIMMPQSCETVASGCADTGEFSAGRAEDRLWLGMQCPHEGATSPEVLSHLAGKMGGRVKSQGQTSF